MIELLAPWNDSSIVKPQDDTTVIFRGLPEHEDNQTEGMEEPVATLLHYKDEQMTAGCLCIGEKGDIIEYWMGNPPLPVGNDLKGWTDCKEEEPKKDGTTYLLLFRSTDGSKLVCVPALWLSDWSSSDLGIDGSWKFGTLSHTSEEPEYWMHVPPLYK